MYSYIKCMCSACPGCSLLNPTKSRSSKLVYNFPIKTPFMVLYVDAYMAGSHTGFEGSDIYLVACCGMCTFSALEPVSGASATTSTSAIMKIQLCFEFCHTIVLDKDKIYYGVCRQALNLLKIICHVLLGDNHNPMLIERLCRYFNKGLTIMCNECDSIRAALECLLPLLYAWNSCPVPGFAFPIDFSSCKHWQLILFPATIKSVMRLLTYWSLRHVIGTGNLSICAILTLVSIRPVTLFLLVVPPVQMLARAVSVSLSINSPVHGE